MLNNLLKSPFFSQPFRPLYLMASFYGAFSSLFWGLGFKGIFTLPAHFWYSHEMIFGYSGAIMVGFLLTAVENRTRSRALKGGKLFLLCLFWLLGRVFIFFPKTIIFSFAFDILFFTLAAAFLSQPIIATKNRRNYLTICVLIFFAAANCDFYTALNPLQLEKLNNIILASLLCLIGFWCLIGSRIIPFFIAEKLAIKQLKSPELINYSALNLPLLAALFLILGFNNASVLFLFSAGALGFLQLYRWFKKEVLFEPVLRILCLGYFCSALGLIFLSLEPFYLQIRSLAISLLAIGGIGFFNIAIITQTTLDYTNKAIYPAPKNLKISFLLMLLSAFIHLLAFFFASAYSSFTKTSAFLFALSLTVYLWTFFPFLISKRADE